MVKQRGEQKASCVLWNSPFRACAPEARAFACSSILCVAMVPYNTHHTYFILNNQISTYCDQVFQLVKQENKYFTKIYYHFCY